MAKNSRQERKSRAGQANTRIKASQDNRRSYVVRALLTVALLLAAVAVLALVQRPNLSGQPATQSQARADAAQNVKDAETLKEPASEAEDTDTAGISVSGAEDSDMAPEMELPVAPSVGSLAPDFTLDDITGQTVSRAALAGKPMFITFFHSW